MHAAGDGEVGTEHHGILFDERSRMELSSKAKAVVIQAQRRISTSRTGETLRFAPIACKLTFNSSSVALFAGSRLHLVCVNAFQRCPLNDSPAPASIARRCRRFL